MERAAVLAYPEPETSEVKREVEPSSPEPADISKFVDSKSDSISGPEILASGLHVDSTLSRRFKSKAVTHILPKPDPVTTSTVSRISRRSDGKSTKFRLLDFVDAMSCIGCSAVEILGCSDFEDVLCLPLCKSE
jgi:hypothetical protein